MRTTKWQKERVHVTTSNVTHNSTISFVLIRARQAGSQYFFCRSVCVLVKIEYHHKSSLELICCCFFFSRFFETSLMKVKCYVPKPNEKEIHFNDETRSYNLKQCSFDIAYRSSPAAAQLTI